MTFKDLQRLVGSQSDVNYSSNPKQLLLARLRDKPFWLWDSAVHKEKSRIRGGHCCFNHKISSLEGGEGGGGSGSGSGGSMVIIN